MEPGPSPTNCSKDYWKLLPLVISIRWPSLVTSWVVIQKMYFVSCADTHCDVTDLVNHGIVKNTKTWISCKQNIIFLWNKKILNLCLRWHIWRSYPFVVEVTWELYASKCWMCSKELNLFMRYRQGFLYFSRIILSLFCNALILKWRFHIKKII